MEEKWITICYYSSEPNRGAGTFINFDEKFPDFSIARPLFYSVLIMPAHIWSCTFIWYTREGAFYMYIF